MIVCASYKVVEITEEHRSFFTTTVFFVSCRRRVVSIYRVYTKEWCGFKS